MRFVSAFLLLSSVSGIRAALLHNWADSESPTWIPTETGAVKSTGSTTGWTPKPTRAPGFVSEQDQVVGLLRRQRQLTDTTAWVNDRTCGWVAQTPSRAILCGSDFTCATNNANLVACVSGTFSPFFRVCMDFSAVQQGQCSDVGPETGCCDDRISPACATWIWTGNPARSQYGCAARSTIYSVMDIPQFVFDSLTRSTTSSTRPSSSTLSTKTASTTGQSSASQSIQTSLLPTTGGTTGGTTGNNLTVGNQTSTTTNLTPIIGGAVGGLAGLILLVLLVWCCLRRRRNKKSTSTVNKSDTKSNTENNTTVNYNVSQENQYTHATTSNTSFNHDKAVANALILEKDADVGNASGGGSNGGGGGGNGAMAAIFCCGAGTRKSKKDKNLEKALQSGRDNAPAHVGMPQSQQQHAVEEHHHHHHYHFDPSANSNTHSRAPSSITAHNSDAGSGFVGPGQQPPARTFSFDVMPQPSHVNHPASLTPHNPYVAGSAGLGLIAPAVVPAMPKHYSHSSPLGISNNSPVPMISELNATPMAGSTTGKYQQHNQHNQPCQQQQQQQQQQQHNEKQQQYPLASQIDHGANTQGAQQLASYAAYRPSAPPPLITAINTSDNHASTSSSPAPSSSQAVSPSPLSSTASSLPSLHQLQLQPANGDTVLHALHPPPAQSVRASMYGSFHHVSGGTNGQTGEQRGQHQQQQHCNCCVASHHPRN